MLSFSTSTLMVTLPILLFSSTAFAVPLVQPHLDHHHHFSSNVTGSNKLKSRSTVVPNSKWPDNPKNLNFAGSLGGLLGGIIPSMALSIGFPGATATATTTRSRCAARPTTSSTISSQSATTTTSSPSSSTSVTRTSSSSTPSSTIPTSPYKIVQSHSGSSFLDGWDFFTSPDPTHGQVNFVDREDANNYGLTYTTGNGSTVLRVDDYTFLGAGQNRNSVRITSKETVKIGSIVIMDAVLLPFGPSVWPAFWSVGQNWPNGGEIDIMEGVHNNVQNQMTLHSNPGCTLEQPMKASGNVLLTNCDVYADSNTGCGVQDTSKSSYGSGFNIAGGGIYVTHWDTAGISIWFFNRGNIPADIAAGQPNFQNWGTPSARFGSGTCDMNRFFSEQTLVINITLCGDWSGAVYNAAGFSGTCSQAVENPYNYQNAAFDINYVKVYHQ